MHFANHRTVVLAAVCCAAALAGCGSSSRQTAAGGASSGIKFADCMRAHGVPNFPDPGGSGGGIQIPDNSGINPRSPAFQSAQRACVKLLPGGGPGRGHVSESRKLELLKLAQCMRGHGITTFPDPTSSPPPLPPAGGGVAFGAPGSFLAVSRTMMDSPGFKQAASQCGFPGFGGGGPKGAAVR